MKVFIRVISGNDGDKVLLTPLTFKEYLIKVNQLIMERKRGIENLFNFYNDYYESENYNERERENLMEWTEIRVYKALNFQYYPVPCDKYRSTNRWINTKNLEKYRKEI